MSLYGALFAGVSGLSAQASAMGSISDNVTNVNTIGYKANQVNFQTLVTKQVSTTKYSPGGVQSRPRTGVDVQGLLQATTSSTDMGISGQGFFVVSDQALNSSGFGYSRAGSFRVDKDGYLQNVGGFYLQGWPLENWDGTANAATVEKDGNIYMKSYKNDDGDTYYMNDNAVDNVNMRPLNLSTIGGTARATSTIAMGANLPALAGVGATEKTNSLLFDSLGNSHNLNFTWMKRGANSWDMEAMPPAGTTYIALDDQTNARNVYFSAGRLDFTSVPAAGENFTMDIAGNTYTFNFINSDDTNNGFVQLPAGTNNATTVGAGYAAGDTIDIGGVTFTLTAGAGASSTDVDISGAATADDVAALVASAAESYFDGRYGSGNWVKTDGANQIQASLEISGNTGAFGAPTNVATINDNGTNTPGPYTFNIDITGKSLSQVLDALAVQVNTAMGFEMNNAGATVADKFPPNPPGNLASRVAGENAIWFRQFDTNNAITVDASALSNDSGDAAVMQTTAYSVDALSSSKAWTTTVNSGDHYALTFNGDGSIDKIFGEDETSANNPRTQIRVGWANGALDMDGSTPQSGGSSAISLFMGDYNSKSRSMQQLSGDYQLNYLSQNGNKFGNFAGVTIGEDGIVTARFDNGVTTPIFMIPLATFVNPNAMESITGNMFVQTDVSGLPTVREAGSGGAGTIAGASLESSTVDLGEEFTTMITTQRAYSAASKIITTSDEMLDELIRIKR